MWLPAEGPGFPCALTLMGTPPSSATSSFQSSSGQRPSCCLHSINLADDSTSSWAHCLLLGLLGQVAVPLESLCPLCA